MGPFLGKEATLLPMGGLSDSVTVSGISGGGFTATQMHVVHSDMIKGVGLAISGCYGDDYYESGNFAAYGIEKAEIYESISMIDELSNLSNDPVYIFSGYLDVDIPQEK